ncbi:membrane protein [Arthrobacter phage Atuin]|nr:membrane protein [Arthrobacter phage Atuin]
MFAINIAEGDALWAVIAVVGIGLSALALYSEVAE